MYKSVLNGYEAIIFDLDGTVVQSENIWQNAIRAIFDPEILSDKPYYGERGLQLRENIELIILKNQLRAQVNPDVYYKLIIGEFFNNFEDVELTPGFQELAERLKKDGKRLVLATNTDRDITLEVIKRLKIENYFEFVISGEEVALRKPNPAIYIEAIKRLKLPKERILVFEDSQAGALAAELADLNKIVVLPPDLSPSMYGSKTRNFIDDFNDINDYIDVDADTFIEDFFSK
jgi:HAD superfamily hydrolase (TIGR01509 family)